MPAQIIVGNPLSRRIGCIFWKEQYDPGKKHEPEKKNGQPNHREQREREKPGSPLDFLRAKVPFSSIPGDKNENSSEPDVIGHISQIVHLDEGRQQAGEIKMEIAEMHEQLPSPKSELMGGGLIQKKGILKK
jgi:hypothetical protein